MHTLRIQHLAGYGLEVPDLQVGEDFYTAYGLRSQRQGDTVQLHSQQSGPAAIVLMPGAQKRLHHLSFAVQAQDLERFAEHLKALGTPTTTPAFAQVREGLWFQDPWGTWINLVAVPSKAAVPASTTESPPKGVTGLPRTDRHLWRELPRQIRPNRLGHMLMYTPDWEKAEAYYCQALGFRVSDRAAGKVAFLSGGEGVRDHHCFGLINGTHRGFQHGSFHVDTIDDIGFGALQMHQAGFKEGFGPGRHALASNLFYYVRDPWGSWIEYYADMDKISEDWQAKDWNELPYIWPAWAPEFWTKEMNANFEPR
jgi:catechol-2,3-dioxygenase